MSAISAPTAASTITPVSMTLYDKDFQAFSDELGASFTRFGFGVVAVHGLDEVRIAAAIDAAKTFFALPEATKRQYHQPGTGGARGLSHETDVVKWCIISHNDGIFRHISAFY